MIYEGILASLFDSELASLFILFSLIHMKSFCWMFLDS